MYGKQKRECGTSHLHNHRRLYARCLNLIPSSGRRDESVEFGRQLESKPPASGLRIIDIEAARAVVQI
jgi:hypothetical protein